MKKICIHWTAGSYSSREQSHYHFTVSPGGQVYEGHKPPEANIPPLKNGKYVPHCGGGNSWCIGIAMMGMAGFRGPDQVGKYPLTAVQCEATWKKVAELCLKYGIPIHEDSVFTHYAFGKKHPESESAGKIDITYLPHRPELGPDEIDGYIRAKVAWYLDKLKKEG